jgi:glycerol-3-phosphate dehydrogenase (NAD(P)+)
VALGGEPTTLAGLAGMGDLVLTATGTLSRNRSLGMALARGDSLSSASAKTLMVAEGVPTVRSALALAARHGVSLPICAEVAAVLFDGKPAADALASLLGRTPTREDAPLEGRRA